MEDNRQAIGFRPLGKGQEKFGALNSAMYKAVLKTEAEHFLERRADQKLRKKIGAKIDRLLLDPFSSNLNSTKIKDMFKGYRLRVGDYRVIYEVDTKIQTVIIWKINHRSSVYKP